ncbi:MAG: glycerophosphodiester phosphodiesterase family protein [Pseudomonadota bacterium]
MDTRPRYAVADAYAEVWRLKGRMLAVHLASLALFAALLSPVAALALQAALWVSGAPALTDKDIALFLLSPAGALAMTAVAALYLAVQIIGFAAKMAVLSAERAGRATGSWAALRLVVGSARGLIGFTLAFVLRIAAFVLPVLLVGAIMAARLLGEYDINFYLSERPPAFLAALAIGGGLLAALAAVLVPRLLAWALALPLVLFGGVAPGESFAASARAMAGRRVPLLSRLALWFGVVVALGLIVGALTGVLGRMAGTLAGDDIGRLAPLLVGVLTITGLASTLTAALNSAALAHLLLDEADWPVAVEGAAAGEAGERCARWLGAAAVAGTGVLLLGGGLGAPDVVPPEEIAVIAHRGGAWDRPENTMAAMRHGLDKGADWLEIDVQESAEGEVIVVHDSDFMKLAGVPTKVWDVTAAELAEIDIGAWFGPDYAGERTPTLADVLEVAEGRGRVLIELKYYGHDVDLAARVAAVVDAAGMADQVAAMSLSPPQAARMKAVRPDWQVGLLAATALGRLEEVDADFLAVNAAIATPRLIRGAQAAGKPVYVWTVNDAPAMARTAGLGISDLITDRPGLAREVLADLAELSPAERAALALADRLGLTLEAREMRDASP